EGGIRYWSVTGVQTCALPVPAQHPQGRHRMRVGSPGFSGQRLREAREVRSLSVTSLSELANVSAQAIYQYENGRRSPSPDVLAKIALAVKLPPAFFLL